MIISRRLQYMEYEEAKGLNWKRMTRDFTESIIDAYIDMQNNKADKLAVIDLILYALKHDEVKHIMEGQIVAKLQLIRRLIDDGVYSPYKEIERLSQENDVKDKQITKLIDQLAEAQNQGNERLEEELLTKIVQHSINLGVQVAQNVDHVLRKVYWGTNKFPQQFELLDKYLANPETKSEVYKTLVEINESLKKGAEEGVTIVNTTNFKPQIQNQNVEFPIPSAGLDSLKQIE